MNEKNYCIVTTTIDDETIAHRIARHLLEKRLVACVQTYPVTSTYRWENKVMESREFLLQMKTRSTLFRTIQNEIETLHSYEVPEIVMSPISEGNPAYLKWIDEVTV